MYGAQLADRQIGIHERAAYHGRRLIIRSISPDRAGCLVAENELHFIGEAVRTRFRLTSSLPTP